jgi:integrase
VGRIKDRWYTGPKGARVPTERHGRGRRWQVWVRVDGREVCGGAFDVKAVAQRKLRDMEAAAHRGQWIDTTDRTTVAEYARRWAAPRPYKATTRRRVDDSIRKHIEGTWLGGRRLAAVLPSDVQAWTAQLSQTLAPATVAQHVNLLKAIYRAAVLDRLVASSPVVRVALPRVVRERVTPLTVAQVRALADEVPARCRAMVLTQAGLGLRVGELLALRVVDVDVDFLRRTVRVQWQLAEGTRERVDLKTPRSRRTVPLPRMVAEALAEHIAAFPPLDDGSLFYGHNGRPYHHAMYGTRLFKAAVRRLAERDGFPGDTTTHDLRHHYVSLLLDGGESVVAVAERIGDDPAMVLKVYGHLMPDTEDRTRKAVDDAWTASTQPPAAQARPK